MVIAESENKNLRRRWLIYGSAGLVAVCAVALGLHFSGEEGPKNIRAGDVCEQFPDKRAAVASLKPIVPYADKYGFLSHLNSDGSYDNPVTCAIQGDGDSYVWLKSELVSDASWQKWLPGVLSSRRKEPRYFDAGIKGISYSKAAIIDMPCYLRKEGYGAAMNLAIIVEAGTDLEGSAADIRRNLVDLTVNFARGVHKEAHCDRPSRLPDSVALH